MAKDFFYSDLSLKLSGAKEFLPAQRHDRKTKHTQLFTSANTYPLQYIRGLWPQLPMHLGRNECTDIFFFLFGGDVCTNVTCIQAYNLR